MPSRALVPYRGGSLARYDRPAYGDLRVATRPRAGGVTKSYSDSPWGVAYRRVFKPLLHWGKHRVKHGRVAVPGLSQLGMAERGKNVHALDIGDGVVDRPAKSRRIEGRPRRPGFDRLPARMPVVSDADALVAMAVDARPASAQAAGLSYMKRLAREILLTPHHRRKAKLRRAARGGGRRAVAARCMLSAKCVPGCQ